MTTPPTTDDLAAKCPKCGADPVPCGPKHDDYVDARWACNSYLYQPEGNVPQEFRQNIDCKIRVLEAEVARLTAAIAEERERCAKIALSWSGEDKLINLALRGVAAEIKTRNDAELDECTIPEVLARDTPKEGTDLLDSTRKTPE